MMKHRTFALFLALGLSLSLLSGCGPKESGSTSQPGGPPASGGRAGGGSGAGAG